MLEWNLQMRGTSPQRLPYLLGGAGTPPFGMQVAIIYEMFFLGYLN